MALATWRLSSLVVYEDGPLAMFVRLRSVRALDGVTSCLWCTSVWTGLLIVLCERLGAGLLVDVLALSAAAIGVEDARNRLRDQS
jgi:hypothetical protein